MTYGAEIWGPAVISAVGGAASSLLGDDDYKAPEWNGIVQARQAQIQRQSQYRYLRLIHKRLGINPLYSVGSGSSYPTSQPIMTGGNPGGGENKYGWLKDMGQDIARAIAAQKTPEEKAMDAAKAELVRNQALYYKALATKTVDSVNGGMSSTGDSKGIPVSGKSVIPGLEGQADVNSVQARNYTGVSKLIPDESKGFGDQGHTPSVKAFKNYRIDEDGYVWSLLDQDVGDSMDADLPNKMAYVYKSGKNWVSASRSNKPPKIELPAGKELVYDRSINQWQIVKERSQRRKDLEKRKAYNSKQYYNLKEAEKRNRKYSRTPYEYPSNQSWYHRKDWYKPWWMK